MTGVSFFEADFVGEFEADFVSEFDAGCGEDAGARSLEAATADFVWEFVCDAGLRDGTSRSAYTRSPLPAITPGARLPSLRRSC